MQFRLDGKTALITGGSRGIGKGIAKALADAGAKVMISARKQAELEAAAAEIGGSCSWYVANAGDPAQAEACVAATLQHFGGLDILVNNAATNPYAGPLIDADLPRFDKTVQINLRAPLLWTQLAWRASLQQHGGVVINVASVGGMQTAPALGLYNVTKAALLHMTRQLAAELAPKVRVNAIAPGLVRTDFSRMLWEDGRGEQIARMYPLQRLGEVEDIGAAALYLAADSGSWMTGQTLVLDGGGLIALRMA